MVTPPRSENLLIGLATVLALLVGVAIVWLSNLSSPAPASGNPDKDADAASRAMTFSPPKGAPK